MKRPMQKFVWGSTATAVRSSAISARAQEA